MQIFWLPSRKKTLAVTKSSMLPTPVGSHFILTGIKHDTHSSNKGHQQQGAAEKDGRIRKMFYEELHKLQDLRFSRQ
jgi:hypothetical protein